jgi:hypothetical protein
MDLNIGRVLFPLYLSIINPNLWAPPCLPFLHTSKCTSAWQRLDRMSLYHLPRFLSDLFQGSFPISVAVYSHALRALSGQAVPD